MEISPEQEFKMYEFIHKQSVLGALLIKFYEDLDNTGVSIPSFLTETPEEKARKHLNELMDNPEEFERLYEKSWEKLANYLP